MSFSVGEIGLDLVVNRNGFDRQMRGIQGMAKKAGAALAAAFSIKKLVDFSKKCIELGSDLAEVQNVVDVTFPKMTEQVDKFAKSAAASFGLSETMAKRYTGTFGAMAKAFGFTEKQAYDMGTTLTGLAGDVASFYNISQEEAYTKLKSVFTGETESLKDLGVVMTQTALDSYALANGWGKTTSAMSEAEKAALRYSFVQKQLSAAQGDFARTSDSWANQVRILKLQIDSVMATIGQGLINLLTPVIKIINAVISRIATLANAFKSFTELLTGNKSSPGKGIEETTGSVEELEGATEGVGSAAEKAAKKMKGLMSFDKLNNIQTSDSGSGSAAGSSVDFGSLAEGADEAQEAEQRINPVLDSMIKRLGELGNLFKEGFKAGLGESFTERLNNIREHLQGIRDSLAGIFTAPEVVAAANKCADSIAYALGQVVGSVVSIGTTIAQNLAGGIDKYLEQNKGFLKEKLVSVFDIAGEIALQIGEACESIAYIFEAFGSENGQQLTANIIGIFADAFMGISEFVLKTFHDVANVIIQPFVDNKERFRTALEGFLGILAEVTGTIKQGIDDTFDKLIEVFDKHFKPVFDANAQGLSDMVGKFLEFWNGTVQPILEEWAEKFDILWKEHIQPYMNKVADLFGSIADLIKALWENIVKPFEEWLIQNVLPVVMPIFENIYNTVVNVIGAIMDIFSGLVDFFKGVIDFLTGVFSGDWERAFDGITTIVIGTMDTIKGVVELVISVIGGYINDKLAKIKAVFESTFNGVISLVKTIFNAIKSTVRSVMDNVKEANERSLNAVKNTWSNVMSGIKNTVSGVFDSILNTIEGAISKITGLIDNLLGLFGKVQTEGAGLAGLGAGTGIVQNIGGSSKMAQKNINPSRFAKGGIISSPTLAMMGENYKKEAVVPLERNLGWRDAIADRVSEKVDTQGSAGGGLTAAEMRSIMAETVRMFAQLIGELDIRATYDKSDVYKAVKEEYKIESKRK